MLIDLGELHAGENTSGLEYTVGFSQSRRHVGKVADAESDSVEVERVVGDGGGDLFGIGFEER